MYGQRTSGLALAAFSISRRRVWPTDFCFGADDPLFFFLIFPLFLDFHVDPFNFQNNP
jgi:hypothetical protein